MSKVFDLFIERWRIPFSITVIGLIGGVFGLRMMKLETYPPVNIGTTIITTSYPGATAQEVNEDVTQKIEDELREVNGFKDVTSVSQSNLSRIIIRTDIDRYDAKEVLEDIQEAVARVPDLPDGVSGTPVIKEIKSSEFPVYRLLLTAPKRGREHDQWADRLKDEFERVSEVARVQLDGFSDREFHILLNPRKMERLHISIQEIVNAIRGRLKDVPAGDITIDNQTKLVRLTGEEYDIKQLRKIVVRSIAGGQVIQLKDLAEIEDRYQDKDTVVSYEGRDAISVVVTKKEKADTLDTMAKLDPILAEFKKRLPKEYEIVPYDNESLRVQKILKIVVGNAVLGFVIVAILLLIFFPSVLGVMTAFSLPIVVMLTLAIMPFIGADFNRITLLAIIICLGLLVDNSIVVSENYVSLRQRGLAQVEAAKRAVQQFWIPLTATVLTTVAAFAPMLVTKGVMGDFIKYIPIVVTLALIISLLESFVLLPSRLRFTYRKIKKVESEDEYGLDTSWFGPIQKFFERFIMICLKMRYLTLAVVFGLFASAIFVQAKWNYFDVFPANDVETYLGRFEAAVGTPLDTTRKKADRLMQSVRKEIEAKYGEGSIKILIATIGDNGESPSDAKAKFGDHLGSLRVIVPLDRARDISADEFKQQLRVADTGEFNEVSWTAEASGPPVGKALEMTLSSLDAKEVEKAIDMFKDELAKIKGVFDISDDEAQPIGQIDFNVDDARIAAAGLSYDDLGLALRSSVEGAIVANVSVDGENINIRVRQGEEFRGSVSALRRTSLLNKQGRIVSLSRVAELIENKTKPKIKRYEFERAIGVSANVDNENINSVELNQKAIEIKKAVKAAFPGVTFSTLGQAETTNESMESLFAAFILAALAIFLILVALFNSFLIPLVVLTSIPLGLIGVLWAFALHGIPLSFFAVVGIVGLAGVVVNGTIILVSYLGDLQKDTNLRGSQLFARATSARLKPVLVTTLTTVGGLLPTAYGLGGQDSSLVPLTLALGWGILSGTSLLLVATPCLLKVLEDFRLYRVE